MPRVPSYQRQVSPGAAPTPRRSTISTPQLPTDRVNAVPSPDSFGAGLGDTMERVGSGLLGQQLQVKQQLWQQEKDRQDRARALNADRQLNDFELAYLDDPEKGLFATHRGADAAGIHETASKAFQDQVGKLYAGLANDDQREMVMRLAQTRQQDFSRRVLSYQSAELKKFAATDFESGVKGSIDAGIANANDPVRIGIEAERIRTRVYNYGKDYGMGSEWIEAQTASALSQLHTGVLGRMLAAGNDQTATAYFDSHKDGILGSDLERVEKALDVGSAEGDAMRAADEIWTTLGPKADLDPANIDAMADAARKQFAKDPKRAKATIANLKERADEFKYASKERADATEASVWLQVLQGTTRADLFRNPNFLLLPGDKQNSIANAVDDRLYTLDQRAKSAADYLRAQKEHAEDEAFQKESRLYTRRQWKKQDEDEAAFARYEELLSDPDAFSKMTESALILELPTVGRTNLNNLISIHKQLNAAAKVKKATLETDLFNDVAEGAGLPVYKEKKTPKEKATLGALRSYVMERIAGEQAAKPGTELDREQKRDIMEKALLDIVPASEPWLWFNTPAKRAFEVTIGDIPTTERQKIEAVLRGTGLRFTEQDVVDAYIEQQERTRK